MEARFYRAALCAAALLSTGASYRSDNFIVTAASDEVAKEVCRSAEQYRKDLAIQWLGKPMPTWSKPCPITVEVAENLGAGGATSFVFDHGEVFSWEMNIQGSLERVLDSVLPHEVTHTIFASYFRCPLPRWADEGACTTVEHPGERQKQQKMLINYLREGRGIAFSQMFAMKEYPRDVLPLYAQGHSLTSFLIDQKGRGAFLAFVRAGLNNEQWVAALNDHYGYKNLGALQDSWLAWVKQGSPLPVPDQLAGAKRTSPELLTSNSTQVAPATFRGQSPDVTASSSVQAASPYSQVGAGDQFASAETPRVDPFRDRASQQQLPPRVTGEPAYPRRSIYEVQRSSQGIYRR